MAQALRGRGGRWLRLGAAAVIACYVSGLLAVNLVESPYFAGSGVDSVARSVFPRIGGASSHIDSASIEQEWQAIQDHYVYRNLGADQATEGTEWGIVDWLHSRFGLDRFSAFLTKSQFDMLKQQENNLYSGSVGVSIEARCLGGTVCVAGTSATELVLSGVRLGMPADKAGVQRGDVLVAVDKTEVASLSSDVDTQLAKVPGLIRGRPGTAVSLTLRRGSRTLTVSATRADLTIPSVYAKRIGSILYVEVIGFDSDTGKLVKQLLQQNLNGATGIILDLRGNGGGYVTAAQELASQFLTPGGAVKDVMVRRGRMDQNGDPNTAQTVTHDAVLSGGVATQPKMVVLVDSDTASASEIVAASLRDYHRATLVGVKTFGKGSVQDDFPLPDGNDLHLTVEKWYGPDGENIDGVGITPDKVVPLPNPDAQFRIDVQSGDPAQDAQFQAALHLLQ